MLGVDKVLEGAGATVKKIKKKRYHSASKWTVTSSPEVAVAPPTPSVFKGSCPGLWASRK